MCGIAGLISNNFIKNNDYPLLKKLMEKRGPDSFGSFKKGFGTKKLNLFFSRLSIIDINKRSNQPMKKHNKVIIFNGEIYNYIELKKKLKKYYSFKTDSDTEVLLTAYHHYGKKFVKYLEGMWAFCIYDFEKKKIIMSRDRFGEKPLYYRKNQNSFYFGSEINYIHFLAKNLRKKINKNKIYNYLYYGYKSIELNDETFFENIFVFPKGEIWEIDKNLKIKKQKYYYLNYKNNNKFKLNDINKNIENKIYNSIKLRLRSDVKLGLSLSGGIDSSLILAFIKKKFKLKIDTFSIIDKDNRFNESKNINTLKKYFNLKNHTDIFFSKKNCFKDLKAITKYTQQPVFTISTLINFQVAKFSKKKRNLVMLTGVGSDEIFAGYYFHYVYWLYDKFKYNDNYNFYLKEWNEGVGKHVRNNLLKKPNLFFKDIKDRNHLLNSSKEITDLLLKKNNFNKIKFVDLKFNKNLLRNRMLNDIFRDCVPIILNQEDANYMFHSVENRCPYLDTDLVKYANTIPNKYLINNGFTKFPLRNIARKYLPKEITENKQKIGFNASLSTIFNISKKSNLDYCLEDSVIFNFIDKKKFKKFIKKKNFHRSDINNKFLFNFILKKIFLNSCNNKADFVFMYSEHCNFSNEIPSS